MKTKRFLAALCAITLSFGASAQASSISVATFDLTAFASSMGGNFSLEDFETYSGGALNGPLSGTSVGTFSSLGGVGSGSTCRSNGGGTCSADLAIQDDGINGQGNLVPIAGSKSLNSNDTLGIKWDVSRVGSASFNRLIFGLRDGGEFQSLTVSAGGETATFGPGAGNGNEKLVVVDFSGFVTSASVEMRHSGLNDGFTIDAATAAAVPLPAGAVLAMTGLAGLMAIGRKRRRKPS